jgi:N-acetylglucosaminyldiphosphoundecaprenol N-acetyl-beta-D-mannosaminyltransferase
VKISNYSIKVVIDKILTIIEQKKSINITVLTANANSIVIARKDTFLRDALNSADFVIPDGIGIIWAAKMLKQNIKKRITGPDFFFEFSRTANEKNNITYFFLGSTITTLEKIKENMARSYPNIKVAGYLSPPFVTEFSEKVNNEIIELVNSTRPDVLWVGLTAPKQETYCLIRRF